jgi:predicted KAP-like P-loop ATPase
MAGDRESKISAALGANKPHLSRPERPIQSDAEDVLERGPFVHRLASALIDEKTQRATGVVIGVTGPWGSGKSSILNLLRGHLKTTYPNALVVSFDPWLISGRNDLITAFIRELVSTIKSQPKLSKKLKTVTKTITKYGKTLSPAVNLIMPGAGIVMRASLDTAAAALSGEESLTMLRERLMNELERVSVPIVVLIDELDRVEDHEIRSVAQLVRSVADFHGISYVLAYDPRRVIQALGEGAGDESRDERGRVYLEKIVQLQIPLPITFEAELDRLLTAEIKALKDDLELPKDFETLERYGNLVKILTLHVLQTPRDIKRFVGTFHALGGMLANEVDWIDVLAYCALLIKFPRTVDNIRSDPNSYVENAVSEKALTRKFNRDKVALEDRLSEIVPDAENSEGNKQLLGFLFPSLSKESSRPTDRMDALCLRRPLLTTLRLGLIPGDYSRSEIEALVRQEPEAIERALANAYADDTLAQLMDRLDALYLGLTETNHVAVWKGIAGFLRKRDCEWMTSFSPMVEVARGFASVLERAVLHDERMSKTAMTVFSNLRNCNEDILTAFWLRHHVFIYGLFGHQQTRSKGTFLDKAQTETLAREMAITCRALHMAGKLIPCRWDLQPVYTMLDVGLWDDQCRDLLDKALGDNRALDGFALMLYGGPYTTGTEVAAKLCTFDSYIERVRARLASPDLATVHQSVVVALQKAERGGL